MTITERCKRAGITRPTYYNRIKSGMSAEEALNTPPTTRHPSYVYLYNDEWLTLQQIATIKDITYSQAYCRYVVNSKYRLQRKEIR